jgi:hypothetical protein
VCLECVSIFGAFAVKGFKSALMSKSGKRILNNEMGNEKAFKKEFAAAIDLRLRGFCRICLRDVNAVL